MDSLLLKDKFQIHYVAYDNLLERFKPTLQRMLEYLSLELNLEQINQIAERVSFSHMKRKNPGHVKKEK